MIRGIMARKLLILAALAPLAALAAAPSVFGGSRPGLWELSGVEGRKAPFRVCVTDLAELARIEHRGQSCKQTVVRQAAGTITYNYNCSATDFGRSKMDSVTTNNIRIDTQGISGSLPFAHKVQARRVGDCAPKAAPGGRSH